MITILTCSPLPHRDTNPLRVEYGFDGVTWNDEDGIAKATRVLEEWLDQNCTQTWHWDNSPVFGIRFSCEEDLALFRLAFS